jgi:multiple sugar transport system permease protein
MMLKSRRRIRQTVQGVLFYLVLGTFTLACLTPFIWTISTAFKKNADVFKYPPHLIPSPPSVQGFTELADDPQTFRSFFNSISITGLSTVAVVSISSVTAYSMSRFRYRGKQSLRTAILISQMLPPVFILIPYFQLTEALGLYNTYAGLLIGWSLFSVPFCTLMLHGFFNSISVELDEAALLDGCGRLGALFRVVLPVSLPGLLGTAAVIFVFIWGDLLLPLVLVRSRDLWTVVPLLSSKVTQFSLYWNQMAALAILACIPLVVVWMFGQRYVVSGLTAGMRK